MYDLQIVITVVKEFDATQIYHTILLIKGETTLFKF